MNILDVVYLVVLFAIGIASIIQNRLGLSTKTQFFVEALAFDVLIIAMVNTDKFSFLV